MRSPIWTGPDLPPPPDVVPPPNEHDASTATFVRLAKERDRLRAVNADLLAALRDLSAWANLSDDDPRQDYLGRRVSAAIARAIVVVIAALLCGTLAFASDLAVSRKDGCEPGYHRVATACVPDGIADGPDPVGRTMREPISVSDDPDPFGTRSHVQLEDIWTPATEAAPQVACGAEGKSKCWNGCLARMKSLASLSDVGCEYVENGDGTYTRHCTCVYLYPCVGLWCHRGPTVAGPM